MYIRYKNPHIDMSLDRSTISRTPRRCRY